MTISKKEIQRRMKPGAKLKEERIIVTPILSDDQFGSVEINLRLGRQFIIFKKYFHESLGPISLRDIEDKINKYQEEIIINYDGKIILHPGEFLIGSTLEYIVLPNDLEAQVEGRSSWARLGLIIATATTIHPLYKGVITLELSNNGTIPIELMPTLEIAQIVFHKVEPPVSLDKESRYSCAIGPAFSRIHNDRLLFRQ